MSDSLSPAPERGERRRWRAVSIAAVATGVGALVVAAVASAADAAAGDMPAKHFHFGQLLALLFLMLGPKNLIHPFLALTRGADAALVRRIALRATVYASLALLFAAFIGESLLAKYSIPLPVLGLAGGVILFLVALQGVLEQFAHVAPHDAEDSRPPPKPTVKLALAPIAFPIIVTPYGIAALIVFLALAPDLKGQLMIGGAVLAIMLLNLGTMLVVERIVPVLTALLPVLGAIFGVIQVAVGLQFIHNALRELGVL